MIFRQLFDSVSGTYTYLLASRRGGEALIIDPVLEKVDRYLQLVQRARPQAGQGGRHPPACRPHHRARRAARPHALHHRDGRAEQGRRGLDAGRRRATSSPSRASALDVLYTPGHTDDSYSFLMRDRVFTGDTLLIRGTGRTDFQNGDPRAQYDSIFNKLLKLPDETLVFPAHDYKGETVSTIGEEKAFNPRLQVKSVERICRADEQPQPAQSEDDGRGGAGQHARRPRAGGDRAARLGGQRAEAMRCLLGEPNVALIDLREKIRAREARRHPGLAARALPRPRRQRAAGRHAARARRAPPASASLFYCAFGERSAMAVQAAQDAGHHHRPATSRAASTPGRRPAARWRVSNGCRFRLREHRLGMSP